MKKFIFYILLILLTTGLYSQKLSFKWSEPVNLSELNTSANDFAPSWNRYENFLFFNSDISGYSKFYSVKYNGTSKFSEPKPIAGDINQSRNNQSYISFESSEEAYLSTFRLTEKRSYLNIYHTKYRKMSWSKPVIADSLQFDAFTSHPTISPDGSIMIFSSDRNTEHNETDLWMASKQDNGSWGAIINLSELNSPGNEITPFLASKDTLYFASDGQEGPGGFDMFMSVYEDGKWGRPNPLTELNTNNNESDITFLPAGEIIFASDRPGGKGKLDLYMSKREEVKKQITLVSENIEINIASQVMSVQSKKQTSSQLYELPNFVLNNWVKHDKDTQIANHPDSIYNYSINILGGRLNENPASIITLECNSSSKTNANNIKEFLKEKFRLADNRIIIDSTRISTDNLPNEPVIISSNDKNILKNYEAKSDEIVLSPPVLELSVDARPRKDIKEWFCSFITKNFKFNNIIKGDTLPAEFTINLSDFDNQIDESDSIIIKMDMKDNLGNIHSNNLILTVNHSLVRESNSLKVNGRIFQQFIIFAFNKAGLIRNSENINSIILKLKEKAVKKVIVQYSLQNNSVAETAEAISSIIKKENIIAKPEFINISSQVISNSIKPFIFRILIEQ
ncbi:MAG: exo-alpha-sialidase [Bacteroidetes bacterium]|nr:MAG: exo-alpha-sialidase [Bacteroidota bacterium]